MAKVPKWYCENSESASTSYMVQVIWASSTKVGCGYLSYADGIRYKKVRMVIALTME